MKVINEFLTSTNLFMQSIFYEICNSHPSFPLGFYILVHHYLIMGDNLWGLLYQWMLINIFVQHIARYCRLIHYLPYRSQLI